MSNFDHTHLKIIELFHLFTFEILSILESHDQLSTATIDHAHPKKFWSPFNFCESVSTSKKLVIPFVHSLGTVNFRVLSPHWPHLLLAMPTPNIFKHLLIWMNLYQHAKNQLIPCIHSSDTGNFRVQKPDWPCQNKKFLNNF